MRIVSPYRPFPPESAAHRKLGLFDWEAALRMLRASASASCRCETWAITDVDTDLSVPALHYHTVERRLMLWILDVSLRYLESDDFDQDTVMVSPDVLVFADLRRWFTADLGIVARFAPKYVARPILNSAQWWRHAAKDRLVAFYRTALEIGQGLPEGLLRWGADTEPLRQLVSPLSTTATVRAGLSVQLIPAPSVMFFLTSQDEAQLDRGRRGPAPSRALCDFKYNRKRLMAAYFAATVGEAVSA